MKLESNKTIMIIILISVFSVLLIIFMKILNDKSGSYLILDNEVILFQNGKYTKMNVDSLEDELFRMIVQKKYVGSYKLDHIDVESSNILFKLDNSSYAFSMPILGIQKDVEYLTLDKKDFDNNDLNELKKVFKKDKLNIKDFNEANKVIVDLDNNGTNDIIYSVTLELDERSVYSSVFVNLNGNIQVLCEDKDYKKTTYSLEYIIDINNDKKYELIVSKSLNDISNYIIYSLNNNYVESYSTSIGG